MSRKIDKSVVLNAAVDVAERDGFNNINRDAVALKAGVSTGSVSQAYGTMCKLKRAVMRHAIQHELLDIIAVGLSMKDKTAIKIEDIELKKRALTTLL